MSEIENLLNELRSMKSNKKQVINCADTWLAIRAKDWEAAGFADEAEAQAWMADNPYANI